MSGQGRVARSAPIRACLLRLGVRTLGFHPGNRGSNPLGDSRPPSGAFSFSTAGESATCYLDTIESTRGH